MSVRDKILKFGKILESNMIDKFRKKYVPEITKKPTIDLNNLEPVHGLVTFYTAEESAFELDAFHLKNNKSK
jgi:hypothetical protein